MSARRRLVLLAVAVLGIGAAACGGPLFKKSRPSIERVNPNIPGGRFHVLVSIAGGDARTDLQISATVRQRLQDSGFTVVRRGGRWDSQTDAIRAVCESVDGVLFIWYNRLELHDCASDGNIAYEISSGGAEGVTQMTDRLIHYLRQPGGADRAPPPPN